MTSPSTPEKKEEDSAHRKSTKVNESRWENGSERQPREMVSHSDEKSHARKSSFVAVNFPAASKMAQRSRRVPSRHTLSISLASWSIGPTRLYAVLSCWYIHIMYTSQSRLLNRFPGRQLSKGENLGNQCVAIVVEACRGLAVGASDVASLEVP